jgi:hypothetical protein
VRCWPPHGDTERASWSRYAGKVGTVVRLNRTDDEIGVKFTMATNKGKEPVAWFTPDELRPRH